MPCRHDDDVRITTGYGELPRVRMAQGGRGVCRQKQHRHGLAYHERAPDDRHLGASKLHAIIVEKLHDGLGRAGREPHLPVREHAVERACGDAVDVLCDVERRAGGPLVERPR